MKDVLAMRLLEAWRHCVRDSRYLKRALWVIRNNSAPGYSQEHALKVAYLNGAVATAPLIERIR